MTTPYERQINWNMSMRKQEEKEKAAAAPEDDRIITNAMLRAQDQEHIEALEAQVRKHVGVVRVYDKRVALLERLLKDKLDCIAALEDELAKVTEEREAYRNQWIERGKEIEAIEAENAELRVLESEAAARHRETLAELAKVDADRKTWKQQALKAEDERDAAVALLRRYRNETPLGHQPHMIAHEVDALLAARKEGV